MILYLMADQRPINSHWTRRWPKVSDCKISWKAIKIPNCGFILNMSWYRHSIFEFFDKKLFLCLSSEDRLSNTRKIHKLLEAPYSLNKLNQLRILSKFLCNSNPLLLKLFLHHHEILGDLESLRTRRKGGLF